MSVLLLNASWEPLRVIDTKRAIVLVMSEKAEIVHEGEGTFHSASSSISVPAVIRLKRFVQVPFRARLPLNRRALMARDLHVCQFSHCNRTATTIDHVQPRSKGGKHEWTNVVAACVRCNQQKADKTLDQIGWSLKRKPFAPKGTVWLIMGVKDSDPAWEPYLRGVVA